MVNLISAVFGSSPNVQRLMEHKRLRQDFQCAPDDKECQELRDQIFASIIAEQLAANGIENNPEDPCASEFNNLARYEACRYTIEGLFG